jgi:hypothetical protein
MYPSLSVWIRSYFSIFTPAVLVFVLPKLFLDNFGISEIAFSITKEPASLFASRWINFVSMFVLFEVIGIYIVIYGWQLRQRFLTGPQRIIVYSAELIVVVVATALLLLDLMGGKSMAGSNMIGAGNMERALDGYTVFLTQQSAFATLSIMHAVFTTGSVIYGVTAISNYAICGIYNVELQGNEASIKARRDAYYRTLYASAALLTVGVLQLAAWLGLPSDNIVEKEHFTKLVTSITIYLSMLFTLIAVVAATLSAFAFNESVKKYHLDAVSKEKLEITLFDKTMIVSVFLPAIAGYLMKIVPWLFT